MHFSFLLITLIECASVFPQFTRVTDRHQLISDRQHFSVINIL